MSLEIEKAFKERNLTDIQLENYKSVYSYIEKEFKRKFFKFEPPNKSISNIEYYEILKVYLDNHGYGYGAKRVSKLIKNNSKNDVEIGKILMDLNLINKYDKSLKIHGIKNKELIEYDKENGLRKTFKVSYENIVGFKIEKVVYKNKAFISHIQGKNEIEIIINIQEGKKVNFAETIAIYTNYGTDIVEFIVNCKGDVFKDIDVYDIDEYLDVCKNNIDRAKAIFSNKHFREWLGYREYTVQLINYDESIAIHNSDTIKNSFEIFCALNGITLNKDIDTPSLSIEGINYNEHIDYNVELGLLREFRVKCTNNKELKIEKIVYKNKDYIDYTDKLNEIEFKIFVEPKKEVKFREKIDIYYNEGKLYTIVFDVRPSEKQFEGIHLNSINEYLKMCNSDRDKAKIIFENENFRKWLEYKNYEEQVKKYDESIVTSNSFNKFCELNNIKVEKNTIADFIIKGIKGFLLGKRSKGGRV